MEEAIKLARENGYADHAYCNEFNMYESYTSYCHSTVVLDPEFWKSLGKALGWKDMKHPTSNDWNEEDQDPTFEYEYCEDPWVCERAGWVTTGWLYHWHRFIDWIADGKPTDEFFKELLK